MDTTPHDYVCVLVAVARETTAGGTTREKTEDAYLFLIVGSDKLLNRK